ncbi:hypothetical protein GCK32_020247, partial [Trichostrongylus colubriformis]
AFLDQAKKNPRFHNYVKEELDPCLGCSEKLSNVKLFRQCHVIEINLEMGGETSNCTPCQCRPMWATFCIIDVALLSYFDEEENAADQLRSEEE